MSIIKHDYSHRMLISLNILMNVMRNNLAEDKSPYDLIVMKVT